MTSRIVIASTMAARGEREAIFVDDQRDHLRCEAGSGISCRLAVWGHVAPDWRQDPVAEPLELVELIAILAAR